MYYVQLEEIPRFWNLNMNAIHNYLNGNFTYSVVKRQYYSLFRLFETFIIQLSIFTLIVDNVFVISAARFIY